MNIVACMIVRQSDIVPRYREVDVHLPWGAKRMYMPFWEEYGIPHDGTPAGQGAALREAERLGLWGKHTFTLTAKPITWRDWV